MNIFQEVTSIEELDMDSTNNGPTLHSLQRADGQVAYQVSGTGPLVVCVPGMGDLRSSYRFVESTLVAAGHRVAVMDLRGHGDSDATFGAYGDEATAGDMTALIEELGGPAVLVGNSMAAGAAVLVAAERPELVSGLVLIGAFVRPPRVGWPTRVMMRAALNPLWVAAVWKTYLPKLFAGAKPADFTDYRDRVVAALKRPGHAKAFTRTARTSHAAAGAALAAVTAPTMVIMGAEDPDFADPELEANWIADALHGEVVMVRDSGHYPQSQQPQVTGSSIVGFLTRTAPRA